MTQFREVRLELLRHGPAHNQLLSPLTQYLALCGNHGAVTVTIPLEHSHFLASLEPLAYESSQQAGELQLKETASVIRNILAQVPGLIAALADSVPSELSQECWANVKEPQRPPVAAVCTHLELILSASELALLPFELADAPDGFPGAGQSLILQSQNAVCLTRRARRTDTGGVSWLRKPRILFAAAGPPGKIPLQEHVNKLARCLQPWIDWSSVEERTATSAYSDYLTILPRASIDQIERTISQAIDGKDQASDATGSRSRPYTHVHFLAHGGKYKLGVDERFGLVLHDSKDPLKEETVSGARLAIALRAHGACHACTMSCPTVVTIASCQGAQQGSVVGTGASVAHALHEAGIPFVIASQFPLTFDGSVLLVDHLYDGFLRGYDPRALVSGLRRELYSRQQRAHDWASVVAYATLPGSLETQLQSLRINQARDSIELAFRRYDLGPEKAHVPQLREWLNNSREQLRRALNDAPADRKAEIYGLLASTNKKEAQMLLHGATASGGAGVPVGGRDAVPVATTAKMGTEIRSRLLEARDEYRRVFHLQKQNVWGLVQNLSLTAVLDGCQAGFRDDWNTARCMSEWDVHDDDRKRRAQAHANLAELNLLALFQTSGGDVPEAKIAEQLARQHLDQLTELCGPDEWTVKSTCSQIARYCGLFDNSRLIGRPLPSGVRLAASRLLSTLTQEVRAEGMAWSFEPYRWGDDPDDPNFKTVGHTPKDDGFELHITDVGWNAYKFWFDAVVQRNCPDTDWGPVRFALHQNYPKSIIMIRKIRAADRNSKPISEALLEEVNAEVAFTIVAEVMRPDGAPVKLGYDLHKIPNLPKRFKWRPEKSKSKGKPSKGE